AEQVVAVDDGTARGGEVIDRLRVVETRQRLAEGIDRSGARLFRNIDADVRIEHMRVALEVVVLPDIVIHGVGVIVAESLAQVAGGAAKLRLAADRLDQALIRLDAKIAAADADHRSGLDGLDGAARIAVGAIEPAVQAPDQAVGAMLLVAF